MDNEERDAIVETLLLVSHKLAGQRLEELSMLLNRELENPQDLTEPELERSLDILKMVDFANLLKRAAVRFAVNDIQRKGRADLAEAVMQAEHAAHHTQVPANG